jgi:hypothetical protein
MPIPFVGSIGSHVYDHRMTEERNPPPTGNQESRPVDLGLSEGKSMGFAPTGAIGPDAFPIGGSRPIQAAPQGGATTPAAAGDGGSGATPQGGSPSSPSGVDGES